MTTFDEAARKAVAGTVNLVQSYDVDEVLQIDVTRFNELKDEITKHHADLAETFGLLCELARATKLFVMAHDNLETEKALNRSNYNTDIEDIAYIGKAVAGTELRDLLANPCIAALLKKGAFDKGAV